MENQEIKDTNNVIAAISTTETSNVTVNPAVNIITSEELIKQMTIVEPSPVSDQESVIKPIEEFVESVEDNSDAFVTENDIFDINIGYYKIDGDMRVDSVDDDFDKTNPNVKNISVTFKYPSQGDYEAIVAQNSQKSPDKMSYIDVLQMELTRLVILIRRWSINAEFSRMVELDPKIIKAMANKVRDRIGIKGIL